MKELNDQLADAFDLKIIDISEDFATASQYGVQSVPTTVVLDRSSRVMRTFVGQPNASELKAAVETALNR